MVRFEQRFLSFEGYHLFRVSEEERVFVESVVAPVSWWRRLLKSDLVFRNGEGAVVARYRDGSSYLVVADGESEFQEDVERGTLTLTTPHGVVRCPEFTEDCEFECRPESIHGVVAIAVHQLYLKLLRAG